MFLFVLLPWRWSYSFSFIDKYYIYFLFFFHPVYSFFFELRWHWLVKIVKFIFFTLLYIYDIFYIHKRFIYNIYFFSDKERTFNSVHIAKHFILFDFLLDFIWKFWTTAAATTSMMKIQKWKWVKDDDDICCRKKSTQSSWVSIVCQVRMLYWVLIRKSQMERKPVWHSSATNVYSWLYILQWAPKLC